ncbi:MAG: reverse transcriptase family protein [Bacteroidota bacterium]
MNILCTEIASGFFHTFSSQVDSFYRPFEVPKTKFGKPQINADGSEKTRNISASIGSLKFIQEEISATLQQIILPEYIFGGVRKKNHIQNAEFHAQNRYFFKIDLKEYFENISNNHVFKTLRSLGLSANESRIIARLTTYRCSLPKGAPTSPVLSNLVFLPTAIRLNNYCQKNGITFSCFFDDLTFSSKSKIQHHGNNLIKIIKADGFYPNNKKIHSLTNACEVTGILVKKKTIHLCKETLANRHNPNVKAYCLFVERESDRILRQAYTS